MPSPQTSCGSSRGIHSPLVTFPSSQGLARGDDALPHAVTLQFASQPSPLTTLWSSRASPGSDAVAAGELASGRWGRWTTDQVGAVLREASGRLREAWPQYRDRAGTEARLDERHRTARRDEQRTHARSDSVPALSLTERTPPAPPDFASGGSRRLDSFQPAHGSVTTGPGPFDVTIWIDVALLELHVGSASENSPASLRYVNEMPSASGWSCSSA